MTRTWAAVMSVAPHELVDCVCRRQVPADMLVEVPPTLRRRAGTSWACDACLERMFRAGVIYKDEFYEASGAGPAAIAKVRADRAWRNADGTLDGIARG